MPGGDGTGPFGTGPRRGICFRSGYASGQGRSRGFGAPGRFFGYGYNEPPSRDEKQMMEARAAFLEQELAALKVLLSRDSDEVDK